MQFISSMPPMAVFSQAYRNQTPWSSLSRCSPALTCSSQRGRSPQLVRQVDGVHPVSFKAVEIGEATPPGRSRVQTVVSTSLLWNKGKRIEIPDGKYPHLDLPHPGTDACGNVARVQP